jgi:hypothetical protein
VVFLFEQAELGGFWCQRGTSDCTCFFAKKQLSKKTLALCQGSKNTRFPEKKHNTSSRPLGGGFSLGTRHLKVLPVHRVKPPPSGLLLVLCLFSGQFVFLQHCHCATACFETCFFCPK